MSVIKVNQQHQCFSNISASSVYPEIADAGESLKIYKLLVSGKQSYQDVSKNKEFEIASMSVNC